MIISSITEYKKHYRDIQFERIELFKLISNHYHSREVLYPGCSIHISPSFIFPHVVYVDKSSKAAQFFLNPSAITEFINQNKQYKCSPYFQFIQADYTLNALNIKNKFDLVISFFADNISIRFKQYLKKGGVLLTHQFHQETSDAMKDGNLKLIAIIQYRKKKYHLVNSNLEGALKSIKLIPNKKYIKQNSSGIEYRENETYFIFQNVRNN